MTNFCPSNQFDASVLGLEDELRRKTPYAATTPAAAVGTPHVNGSTPGGASTVSGGAGGDDARPRRKKRRRYDEGSYEGYDTFEGEEDAPSNNGSGGNGLGGGGGGGMVSGGGRSEEKKKKKRKKVGISPRLISLFPRFYFVSIGADGLVHCFRQLALCGVETIYLFSGGMILFPILALAIVIVQKVVAIFTLI